MRTYLFRFKDIRFNTDDGAGEDELTANLLNSRYGNTTLTIYAEEPDEALQVAIRQIKKSSGFDILDADYDIIVT